MPESDEELVREIATLFAYAKKLDFVDPSDIERIREELTDDLDYDPKVVERGIEEGEKMDAGSVSQRDAEAVLADLLANAGVDPVNRERAMRIIVFKLDLSLSNVEYLTAWRQIIMSIPSMWFELMEYWRHVLGEERNDMKGEEGDQGEG